MSERPLFRYFGGKHRIADWIIQAFPEHHTYVEPYGGAASVLLRKPRAYQEVINDLNGEVVNVYRQVMDTEACQELIARLNYIPYSREIQQSYLYEPSDCDVTRAAKFIARSYMTIGSDAALRKSGFRSRTFDGGTHPATSWREFPESLIEVNKRLQGVVIEKLDALEVMRLYDRPDTLHYVDPPYVMSSRSRQREVYTIEMDDRDQVKLLDCLQSLQGMVVLSGYDSEIYRERLQGWRLEQRRSRTAKGDAIEILWLSPNVGESQGQLFNHAN